jgi:hypothetical protein
MALRNREKFQCPNPMCKSTTFEIDRLNVCNSHFKPYVIKCGECFTVIGPISNSEFLLTSEADEKARRQYLKAP